MTGYGRQWGAAGNLLGNGPMKTRLCVALVAVATCSSFAWGQPPAGIWHDASNVRLQIGDVACQIVGSTVAKVDLRSLGQGATSDDKFLILAVRITNLSTARKLEYSTWQRGATLVDDLKNNYKAANFGFGTDIVGNLGSAAIYSDKPQTDILVFERPVLAADDLFLELPARNVGGDLAFRLRIPAYMILGFRPFSGPPIPQMDAVQRLQDAQRLHELGRKKEALAAAQDIVRLFPNTKIAANVVQMIKRGDFR